MVLLEDRDGGRVQDHRTFCGFVVFLVQKLDPFGELAGSVELYQSRQDAESWMGVADSRLHVYRFCGALRALFSDRGDVGGFYEATGRQF